MIQIRSEFQLRVSVTITSSSASQQLDTANMARNIMTAMEPMDCEEHETSVSELWNEARNKSFGHRMDEMDCSDKQYSPGTNKVKDIRTETATPMEVDAQH